MSNLLLAVIYVLVGRLSLLLAPPLEYASIAFFPAGMALAAVFCMGKRAAIPGILLGSLLLNFLVGWNGQALQLAPILIAATIAVASALQALLGSWLLRRYVGDPLVLGRDREILLFLLLTPVICLVSASISTPVLILAGAEQAMAPAGVWLTWWAGDTLGVLIAAPVAMSFIGQPAELWRPRRWTLSWPMAIAFTGIVLVSQRVGSLEQKQLEDRFRLRTQETGTLFQVTLNAQQLVQDSVAQLFASSAKVSREEFRSFVRWATARSPNIQVIEWLPRVEYRDRPAYEQFQRAYFGADFSIKDIRPGNILVDAEPRGEYYPITYLEPEAGNQRAQGFDPTSSAISNAAIQTAILSGEAYARPPLMMVRETYRKKILMLYRPIFQTRSGAYTLDKSQGEIAGLVNVAVRTEDMVQQILGDKESQDFTIDWLDTNTGDSYLETALQVEAPFTHRVEVSIAGRDMSLIFSPTPFYLQHNQTHQAKFVMLGGFLISGLFGIFLLSISGRTYRISAEVRQRTEELSLVTERAVASEQRAREMLQSMQLADASLRQSAAAFSAASEAIMITNADNNIVAVNAAFCRITGYEAMDVIGRDPKLIASGQHDRAFFAGLWSGLNLDGVWRGEISNRRKNGEIFTAWLSVSVVRDETNRLINFVAVFSDISDQKSAQKTIERQANYDMLTGLPNRRLFNDRLEQEIRRCNRDHHLVGLLFLDLDQFKDINDTLGHHMGDELLRKMAGRLQECLRDTDTVARLGGDEFTIILTALEDKTHASEIAQKLLAVIQQPLEIGDELVRVGTSIGITFYPDDAANAGALIQNADRAMYAAKESGGGTYSFYTTELETSWTSRRLIKNELERALEQGELQVYYQPIMPAQSGSPPRAEALVRWQHPERGMISPAEFLPMAERMGLIERIDDYVFVEVCQQITRWQQQGVGDVHVSINRSAKRFGGQLGRLDWLAYLRQQRIDGGLLTLEITESVLMEAQSESRGLLQGLRGAGVSVSIDDFGTGYSSLAYLKQLDVDFLKIDQSFVRDLELDEDDRAIIEAIIMMAKRLDIRVVAEGVETASQKDILVSLGCDWLQGYYFARPMPAAEFERYVMEVRAPISP